MKEETFAESDIALGCGAKNPLKEKTKVRIDYLMFGILHVHCDEYVDPYGIDSISIWGILR